MNGKLITFQHPLNGPTAMIRWNDGESEELHPGSSVILEDGSEHRIEVNCRDEWYLVGSPETEVNGLEVRDEG